MKKTYNKLIIIGVGGHAKVLADIAVQMKKYDEIAFLCHYENKKECLGFPIVGDNDDAVKYIGQAEFIVGIGDTETRKRIMEELVSLGAAMATLVHPNACIGSRVLIGEGTVIMAGTVINAETVIGKGCIVNTSSSVDHNCRLGDYVHVSVGAHLCGVVTIGEKTWVGAGATVVNGVHVCPQCMIGAGAVVVKNIKEQGTYVGVPAKKIGSKSIVGVGF